MPAGRGNDAALPWRARRRCVCAYSTLFALRAKALQSGAPDIGVSRKKQFHKRFAHQGGFVGAPGDAKPFTRLSRGSVFPLLSREENGGLCPHPPKGSIPWESLFGEPASSFPVSRPPKRRRRQAPARGLAAVFPRLRPMRNETKHPCPLLVGHGCVFHAPKALADRTAVRGLR